MSYMRAQSRAINKNVYFENRLTTFTNPPIYTGDLIVERDETVRGNLTVGNSLHANSYYATGNYYLNNYILIPAGTIIQSAAINLPGGWFDCNGASYNATVYLDLYAAIGTTYGGASGVFNVPDMRGRVGVGFGSAYTLGQSAGEERHTITASEMPSHTHTGTTASDGAHTHSSNAVGGASPGLAYRSGANTGTTFDSTSNELDLFNTTALTINSAGAHTHTFTTASAGSDASHNNMQPYVVLRYLIKY